jgi:hypothetical protein
MRPFNLRVIMSRVKEGDIRMRLSEGGEVCGFLCFGRWIIYRGIHRWRGETATSVKTQIPENRTDFKQNFCFQEWG